MPQLGDDESYKLTINNKVAINQVGSDEIVNKNLIGQASINIQAHTDFGALHGLTTLVQIITTMKTRTPLLLPRLNNLKNK